ncbi:hypothetical protein PG985_013987 [Apiospora marii]|uniref:uncharacterized protein n=1 Tax=Apiospora marii TaxID=335849 RepID=UPI00312FFF4E
MDVLGTSLRHLQGDPGTVGHSALAILAQVWSCQGETSPSTQVSSLHYNKHNKIGDVLEIPLIKRRWKALRRNLPGIKDDLAQLGAVGYGQA